jgi:hypothetical protein
MAQEFSELTKRFANPHLPKLLALLFGSVRDPEAAFELIFSNVGKKMRQNHKEILFSSIYLIAKKCSSTLFEKVKGKVIYALTSLEHFGAYVSGEIFSFGFINLLCYVGKGTQSVQQRVKSFIRKSELIRGMQCKDSYELKWLYLRLYHFLYVES